MSNGGDVPANGLQLSAKDRAECIHNMYTATQRRRETRMSYEWKLAFGVWTAFGAAIGLGMRADSCFSCSVVVWIIASVLILAICVAFAWWRHDILKSHEKDRIVAMELEGELRNMCGLQPQLQLPARSVCKHHSTRTQLLITFLLAFLLCLVLGTKLLNCHPTPPSVSTQSPS